MRWQGLGIVRAEVCSGTTHCDFARDSRDLMTWNRASKSMFCLQSPDFIDRELNQNVIEYIRGFLAGAKENKNEKCKIVLSKWKWSYDVQHWATHCCWGVYYVPWSLVWCPHIWRWWNRPVPSWPLAIVYHCLDFFLADCLLKIFNSSASFPHFLPLFPVTIRRWASSSWS